MNEEKYPFLEKLLSDFLYEEEANISRNKVIAVGTVLALATLIWTAEVFAKHSSHSSHSSHGSHGSHSSHTSGAYHRSHVSHISHTSHTSSVDHSSHASYVDHDSHASHASHGSAAVRHTSHASVGVGTGASHVNSGVSELYPETYPGTHPNVSAPTVEQPLPEGIIDIRIPKIPPDSPPLSELDGGGKLR